MNIKELRKQLGLTQEKFAKEIGTSVMTIRRWESGKHKPSNLALWRIQHLQATQEQDNEN